MIFWYRNSFLASMVSIFGCVGIIGGISGIAEGEVAGGIMVVIMGIPLIVWGKIISNNKAFKVWWKQVTDANLEPKIAQDINTAVAIYNKNPQKRTLKKIEALNPAAAAHIQQSISK